MINSVERYVYKFIIENNITCLPVQFDTLVSAAENLGFKVRFYDESKEALKQLGLTEMTRIYNAMTVDKPPLRYIFLDDQLPLERRRFSLGHEIGHIVLTHTNYRILGKSPTGNKEAENIQEQEADSFSDYLLAPICVIKAAGINSVRAIERKAALPTSEAEHIFISINDHDGNYDSLERSVLKQFEISIEPAPPSKPRHLPLYWYLLVIVSVSLIGGGIYGLWELIHMFL